MKRTWEDQGPYIVLLDFQLFSFYANSVLKRHKVRATNLIKGQNVILWKGIFMVRECKLTFEILIIVSRQDNYL